MHTDDLDYELPQALIAQQPAERRGDSRLMVIDPHVGVRSIGRFAETLVAELKPDDLVVANDTRVLHARIPVKRETGGAGEFLLLEPLTSDDANASRWRAMARPARKYQPGMDVLTVSGTSIRCLERESESIWLIEIPATADDIETWLAQHGQVPLPPYIRMNGQSPDRYQTVYASDAGSIAAPTAGLHFDHELWKEIHNLCEVATITLHVGAGTFLPIRDGAIEDHTMHQERYFIKQTTDMKIRTAMSEGRRIVAIGTTSTRALESAYKTDIPMLSGDTQLFIKPGFEFQCVGAMLTNFHLPKSTLIALVMAFAGEQTVHTAYQRAIKESMRFYSFGDAMFIHGRPSNRGTL